MQSRRGEFRAVHFIPLGGSETIPDRQDMTPRQVGSAILRSVMYSLTSPMEMAATMCALLLIRGDSTYWSHDSSTISLGPVFNLSLHTKHAAVDYWPRPDTMEDLSLAFVVENYHLTNGHGTLAASLKHPHPKSGDIERETYFKILLVLFKPHRFGNLITVDGLWEHAFNNFVADATNSSVLDALSFKENVDGFHISARNDTTNAQNKMSDEDMQKLAYHEDHRPEHDMDPEDNSCYQTLQPKMDATYLEREG
ncbi:hypothetical protein BC829DRAFT_444287 [Chytridium lagenaria]|nr:hypothetical protein BC829DRAFT_444287 [Chytridium lagenaria]